MRKNYKLIGPFSQIIGLAELPDKGALSDAQLDCLELGGILLSEGRIVAVGNYSELKDKMPAAETELILIDEPAVCLPGFIDCHTHIAFGGSRANDFALRNAGASYLEISRAGGGIWSTVSHTRAYSKQHLVDVIVDRAAQLLKQGITTIEVKSGYGLSVAEELKILRAIQAANAAVAADLVPTCLAAHTVPRDFDGSAADYLEIIANELFPILKSENLSHRIDAFIEDGAFTAADIKPYFEQAVAMGFDITVHADQFSTGGSAAAVAFGALSADHLEASTDTEIALLAQSDVVAVALPGASMGLGCAFTPARKLLDQGASLAIASDWNPGSAPMGQLLCQASVLATFEKLSNAEVLAALTYRAAIALNLRDRGRLKVGYVADLLVFPTSNYQDITYQQGTLQPCQVWKNGNLVFHQSNPTI